tara:strand:+ start:510 stop:740 length:231 start_codon:yes stop_codon:yes gene_type:complete
MKLKFKRSKHKLNINTIIKELTNKNIQQFLYGGWDIDLNKYTINNFFNYRDKLVITTYNKVVIELNKANLELNINK